VGTSGGPRVFASVLRSSRLKPKKKAGRGHPQHSSRLVNIRQKNNCLQEFPSTARPYAAVKGALNDPVGPLSGGFLGSRWECLHVHYYFVNNPVGPLRGGFLGSRWEFLHVRCYFASRRWCFASRAIQSRIPAEKQICFPRQPFVLEKI